MIRCLKGDGVGCAVCVASLVFNIFTVIPSFTFGVFIAEFKRIYDRPMTELDWIGILSIFFTDLLTPIPTVIIQRVGPKGYIICSFSGSLILTTSCMLSSLLIDISWLFLTFSLLNGLGAALILISSTLIVNEFFPYDHKYHVLATSLFQCSFPIAVLFFTPLYAWIIKISSWRMAFLAQGAKIFIVGYICSFIYFYALKQIHKVPIKSKEPNDQDNADDDNIATKKKHFCFGWTEIFKTPERICWLLGMTLIKAIQMVPVINLPHYMEHKGFNKLESSLPLVIIGTFEIVTYLVLIPISSRFQGNLVLLNIVSCFLLTLIVFIWSSIDPSYLVIMVFASAIGCSGMLAFGFIYAASKEVMEMTIDLSWTSSCFFMGFGCIINPLISGLIFDIRNSYDDVFKAVGIASILSGTSFSAILFMQLRKKHLYKNLE